MVNQPLAVVFTNGEIFSNLRYTQAIYDHLKSNGRWSEPLERKTVLESAKVSYTELMKEEPVTVLAEFEGEKAGTLTTEVRGLYQDAKETKAVLEALDAKTRKYAVEYGAK